MKKATSSRFNNRDNEIEIKKGSKRTRIPTEDGFWDCSFCTFKNKSDKAKCDMCGVARGSSTRRPRLTHVTQQFAKIESQIEQEYKKVKKKEIKKNTSKRVSDNSSPNISNPRTVSVTVKGLTVNITEYDMNELITNAASTSSKQDRENTSDNDTMNDGDTMLQSNSDESISESSDEEYLDKSATKRTSSPSKKKQKSNKRKLNASRGNESSESFSLQKKKSKKPCVQPSSDLNSSIEESHSSNTQTSSKLVKSKPGEVIQDDQTDNDSDSLESSEKLKEAKLDNLTQASYAKTELPTKNVPSETGELVAESNEKAPDKEEAEIVKEPVEDSNERKDEQQSIS